jgi:hypothetical protein
MFEDWEVGVDGEIALT